LLSYYVLLHEDISKPLKCNLTEIPGNKIIAKLKIESEYPGEI